MPHRVATHIHRAIEQANKIMLVPHKNPDGDTLGSVAALMQYLRRIDKPHTAYCATAISPNLLYLPHTEYIFCEQDTHVWQDPEVDLVVVFDAGDLAYAGIDEHIASMLTRPTIINVDHHTTNQFYGDHNLVMDTASSTTEILYGFFTYNNIHIDPDMATCLLTGLVTDTDHFTNAGTTSSSLTVAGELISRGGNFERIKASTLQNKTVQSLKLWGRILSRLTHDQETDIVYTHVTTADVEHFGLGDVETEGFANFLNTIGDGKAALILKQNTDGTYKGSFRTTQDSVDVSAYALALGGGGHKKAAGFTVDGPLESARNAVLHVIRTTDNNQA